MPVTELHRDEPIGPIRKEWKARKHEGRHVAWLLTDKYGQLLVCAQKLARIRAYLNERAEGPCDRVHVSGLYQSLSSHGKNTGGYYKNRWKLTYCPVEEASHVLDQRRSGVDKAILITDA